LQRIKIYPERCTGCRVCELVCSFHFTRAFSRKNGAIEVLRNEPSAEFVPRIHQKQQKLWEVCDLCAGEKTYLCAKYCTVGAIEARR